MDKNTGILARAKIILAANSGASDEEIYKLSEVYENHRRENLMSAIIASQLDHKIRFFADFLTTKFPEDAKPILMKAVQMAGNWDNKTQYEELIARYEQEHGEDHDLLIEKLNHCLKYDTKNTAKIEELMSKINNMTEGAE